MGWRDDTKWQTEPVYPSNQFTPRGDGGVPRFHAPVDKKVSYSGGTYVRFDGDYPKRFLRLAVFMDR